MRDRPGNLLSTGGLAARVGYSPSGIKKLVKLGVLPPGVLVEGSGRRVWRTEEVPLIEERIRRRRGETAPTAA